MMMMMNDIIVVVVVFLCHFCLSDLGIAPGDERIRNVV